MEHGIAFFPALVVRLHRILPHLYLLGMLFLGLTSIFAHFPRPRWGLSPFGASRGSSTSFSILTAYLSTLYLLPHFTDRVCSSHLLSWLAKNRPFFAINGRARIFCEEFLDEELFPLTRTSLFFIRSDIWQGFVIPSLESNTFTAATQPQLLMYAK